VTVQYVNLGRSGLKVSPVCLGAGSFGHGPDSRTSEDEARRILDAFLDAGHNFVDTSDMYGGGESEEVLGRLIKGRRDRVVVATKGRGPTGPGPNDSGLSRVHLVRALDASLRRLGTDHVDLYQCHFPDVDTPIEETMATLDGFVRAGKVRYLGCSNFSGSQVVESCWAADRVGGTPFVSLQSGYSLVRREIEADTLGACQRHGLGVMAYSPLGGGVLTAKYRRGETAPPDTRGGRVSTMPGAERARVEMMRDRNLRIADEVAVIAAELGTTATALSLAWVARRRGVTSVIIGPRTVAQYEQNMIGFDLDLDGDTVRRLDAVSEP
jgi:aryl-alcohol dehydrogenase-like predicted oxidoreductase